jgi:hypothetical protein
MATRLKDQYVVFIEGVDPELEFGEAIRKSVAVCRTFKAAYQISLTWSGITDPDKGYKSALELLKETGAVEVGDRLSHARASIALVNSYR